MIKKLVHYENGPCIGQFLSILGLIKIVEILFFFENFDSEVKLQHNEQNVTHFIEMQFSD